MNNKTIFGVLIITYLLILPAQAKDKPEKLLGINDIIAKMQKQLELTDRQAGQIKPIIEEFPMSGEGITEAMERLKAGKMRYRAVLHVQ